MDGVNDLTVTCRVVSMHGPLTKMKVRIFVNDDRNFTIDADLREEETNKEYADDNRYTVKVVPKQVTVHCASIPSSFLTFC